MASQYLPRTLKIPVVGNSGSVSIPDEYAGNAIGISIRPPSTLTNAQQEAATFSWEVFDSESFGQDGAVNCKGRATSRERFQIHSGGSIDLTNVIAAADGDWEARIWYDE